MRRPWKSARLWGVGCLVPLLDPVSAMAQVDEPTVEEFIVTGSRIPHPNLVGASAVTSLDKAELQLTGSVRIEDTLRSMPQVSTPQSAGVSNGTTGTATLDLRNLGAKRTLVLIDGRRLPQGSPFSAGAADINQVPDVLVERVEVLTGGASATYGSDAVAGVVNFILQDDFDGVSVDWQSSGYRHENDRSSMGRLLDSYGYARPGDTVTDGEAQQFSLLAGRNFAGERANITAWATWREIDPVIQADRDYSACSLQISDGEYGCGGSPTKPEGLFVVGDPATGQRAIYEVQGDSFVPFGSRYNFGYLNYFQRPDERRTAGARAHYEFASRAELFAELMWTDDETQAQLAESGLFSGTVRELNCGNPLLSAQQVQVLCTDWGFGPQDVRPMISLQRRNSEGGPRQDELEHESLRGVLGLRGDFAGSWHYELYAQHADVDMHESWSNELLRSRMRKALDVVADPANGNPVCRSVLDGSDPACVPWNIFRTGGVTPEALAYIGTPLTSKGSTEQTVYAAFVRGDLPLVSPLADSAVGLVLGAEGRSEDVEYDPDMYLASGDAASTPIGINSGGDYQVREAYMELGLPLVEGRPWVESLELEAGYRYSDYAHGLSTDTWKLAGAWRTGPTLMLRASLQSAVRAPNTEELFTPVGNLGFSMDSDPCAGAQPERSLADCARTGVTAARYGHIVDAFLFEGDPQRDYSSIAGGNPDLAEETAETGSFGMVYTPAWIHDLSLSIDWYRIEIDDAIAFADGANYVASCLDSGASAVCSRIHRDPSDGLLGGALWTEAGYVDTRDNNLGRLSTEGVDVVVDWGHGIGAWGSLALSLMYGHVRSYDIESLPGLPEFHCAGRVFGACGLPTPRERSRVRLSWELPWPVTLSLLWRHTGSTTTMDDALPDLETRDYWDLTGTWQLTEQIGLRAGVNNLLDESPPLVGSADGTNGNTFPTLYDALGQYWFVGVGVRFE